MRKEYLWRKGWGEESLPEAGDQKDHPPWCVSLQILSCLGHEGQLGYFYMNDERKKIEALKISLWIKII